MRWRLKLLRGMSKMMKTKSKEPDLAGSAAAARRSPAKQLGPVAHQAAAGNEQDDENTKTRYLRRSGRRRLVGWYLGMEKHKGLAEVGTVKVAVMNQPQEQTIS
jgi:hypothetical protein